METTLSIKKHHLHLQLGLILRCEIYYLDFSQQLNGTRSGEAVTNTNPFHTQKKPKNCLFYPLMFIFNL
jgi:hypothetical protein